MSALLRKAWPLAVLLVAPALLPAEPEQARPRRPLALAVGADGHVFVANRCGSVSLLDAATRTVLAETPVGQRLADIAAAPDGRVLAVDDAAHELIEMTENDGKLTIARRVAVAQWPVAVRVGGDGSQCFVTSLWSRTLTVIDLKDPQRKRRTVRLSFAPRALLPLPAVGKVLVADAFGGKLGVVDVPRGEVESVREIPGHNIRGLALSADGKRVLLTHQVLRPYADTTLNEIHWGNLLTNDLRSVPLTALLDPRADLVRASELTLLGDVGNGGGDPAGLAVGSSGVTLVALAGVDEVALGTEQKPMDVRLEVGRRPIATAVLPDGRIACVVSTFSDSVSFIDLSGRKTLAEVSLGVATAPTAVDEGEQLFHDARLSHDGWMSCQSCHGDGHTSGKVSDTQGDGSFGAPKRIASLRGSRNTAPFGWLGAFDTLEAQVRHTLKTTMHGQRKLPDAKVRALVAYLESLPPAPPLDRADVESIQRGQRVFDSQGCAACHVPRSFTSPKTYDVGLVDEVGNRQFNPPSLRGVGQGGPYFHDGRAATLEEVFVKHRHQLKEDLSRQQISDLMAYLGSL